MISKYSLIYKLNYNKTLTKTESLWLFLHFLHKKPDLGFKKFSYLE